MTVALGVFELFTYAIPGSMLFAFCAYVAVRWHLVDLATLTSVSGPLQFAIVAIGSYLLGHLTYLAGAIIDRVARFGTRRDAVAAWKAVNADAEAAGLPPVPPINVMLLLAAVQLRDREAANEISRFRATGLMLRNASVPVILAAIAAIWEGIAGSPGWTAIGLSLLLMLVAIGFLRIGQQLRFWANTKTYQVACWLDLPDMAPPEVGSEP